MTRFRTRAPYLLERLEGGVLRTAHRGAPRRFPDNTLESLQEAAAHPLDYIEVDAHLTRDGQLLLWHDESLITPDGIFEIAGQSLADLRALGLPDGTLATLPEAIEVAQGHTGLMIDLKAADLQGPIGRCLGAAGFREALICGGYLDTLEHLKADLPHVAVSLTPDPAFYWSLAQELPRLPFLDALTVYWRTVGPHMAQAVQAQGVALLAWTVDYPHVARKVLEAGADGITSNNLELLLDLPRRTP